MKTPKQIYQDMPPEDRRFYVEMAVAAVVSAAIVLAL